MFFMMYMLPNGDICHMGNEMGKTFHSVEFVFATFQGPVQTIKNMEKAVCQGISFCTTSPSLCEYYSQLFEV